MSLGLEITGIAFGLIGWILAIVTCALPMWRVSAFIETIMVSTHIFWEGIWMICSIQSTGFMQCKEYDSMLALPQELQEARAMTVTSIILGMLSLVISMIGSKYTNCVNKEATKAKVVIISGVIFIIAGVLEIIPVSRTTNSIIQNFDNPLIHPANKRELGASLYIGFTAVAFLIIGGAFQCCVFLRVMLKVPHPPHTHTNQHFVQTDDLIHVNRFHNQIQTN